MENKILHGEVTPDGIHYRKSTFPKDPERMNWEGITTEDASDAELWLVQKITGGRPEHISPKQWRENMKAFAKDIRIVAWDGIQHCWQG